MEPYPKLYRYQRIVRAKLFIDHHYADHLDLTILADQAHFSTFHFCRLFKAMYGKSPNQYLLNIRIKNAKLLLANGQSVLETSIQVGCESPTSFATLFKQRVGQTPSTFQRAQQVKRKAIQTNPLRGVPNCFAQTYGWTK